MKWSNYNFLIDSEKFECYFLYNTLSNFLWKLDDENYECLLSIKEGRSNENEFDEETRELLIKNKILVENDYVEYLKHKFIKQSHRFDKTRLALTIAPTMKCNLKCAYCFEQSHPNIFMTDDVEQGIIEFIKRHKYIESITVTWYGGEPLLAFDRIVSLTKKIKALGIKYYNSEIITNGFEFDENKVNLLNDLNITRVHITLDGREAVHNLRRPHIEGLNCHKKILDNLDLLSKFENIIKSIRVNIDKSNKDEYIEIYNMINERYPNGNFHTYIGFIKNSYGDCSTKSNVAMTNSEQSSFMIDTYKKKNVIDPFLLPERYNYECIARGVNSYLIDPEGYLYKCWSDAGNKKEAFGHVTDDTEFKIDQYVKYLVGADPFDDKECQKCAFLPICGGGCPHSRLKNKFTSQKTNVCHISKNRLQDYVELYYANMQVK